MSTIDPVRLRPGMKIVCDGNLWRVESFDHRTPGNLRSFTVCKLRSYTDGKVVEKTFRGGADHPEEADFEQKNAQYLYNDDEGFHFMDLSNYEQFTIPDSMMGFQGKMMVPESEVMVSFWDGKPIGVELPPKMVFTIVDTQDQVVKGNSSGNITKDAKLETGLVIQVPSFVKTGEKVRISTADGAYVERVN